MEINSKEYVFTETAKSRNILNSVHFSQISLVIPRHN